jgi:hypothetical protein
MNMMETAETGIATKNQRPQSSGGCIACKAIKFWGDEIGDACPPMLAARAIASCKTGGIGLGNQTIERGDGGLTTRQGPKGAFGGRVRKIGCDKVGVSVRDARRNLAESGRTRTSVKQSVGAATLLWARIRLRYK